MYWVVRDKDHIWVCSPLVVEHLCRGEDPSNIVISVINSKHLLVTGSYLISYFFYTTYICVLIYQSEFFYSSRTVSTGVPTWTFCNMIHFNRSVSFYDVLK